MGLRKFMLICDAKKKANMHVTNRWHSLLGYRIRSNIGRIKARYSPLGAVDVCGEVFGQIVCSGKALATHLTMIGPFTRVDA
jgi:hypothetical protein